MEPNKTVVRSEDFDLVHYSYVTAPVQRLTCVSVLGRLCSHQAGPC